ncbi:MAG: sugar ABC transporter ATP-binding protein, partial [Mesorhizobium sp.]
VIFISHRFVEISALCDRATVLRDGATVGVVDIEPGIEEKIVEMMLGARIEKTSVAAARMASEASSVQHSHPRLVVRNLRLGTKLNDVSFDLANGEV